MQRFAFIHAADVHLDSGFSGLAITGPQGDLVADATRRAFRNLVATAIEREVAFVVIAGDLYDGPWRDIGTAFFLRDQLRRLAEAGIDVFLVKGNHDAESEVADALPAPANLHVFSSRTAGTKRIEPLGVALHGRSFPRRHVDEDISQGYPKPVPGAFNIGLLHTSCDGREGHATYAPCSVEGLRALAYDYWALGHVHAREVLSESPPIVFPGCLQGRHVREAGAKGAVLVTVDGGRARHEFLELDAVRWAAVEVDLAAVGTEDDLTAQAALALEAELGRAGGRPVVARLRYAGETALDATLRRLGPSALLERATALALSLSDALVIEAVRVATRPPAAAAAPSVLPLAPALEAAAAEPEVRAQVDALIDEIARKIPRDADVLGDRPDPAWLIEEARRLLLARAGGEGAA